MAEPTSIDLQMLINYPWPGNIRELGAVIDRAVILGGGHRLEVATSLGLGQASPTHSPADEPTFYEVIPESRHSLNHAVPSPSSPAEIMSLDAAMKQHIERALVATRGKVEGRQGAAHLLRINPHTLRARMRKLGVRWSDFRR
jgi:DNA-binding NtrC family response regulator